MLLLNDPRLIVLKPHKVAGTSLEIALSPFAGRKDIVTFLQPPEETQRRALGVKRGARNHAFRWYELPFVRREEWRRARKRGRLPHRFRPHITAAELRDLLPRQTWDGFTKLAIVRNPYEVALSTYYFSRREGEPFDAFWLRNPHLIGRNRHYYTIEGANVIDRYLRYEHILDDLDALERDYPMLAGTRANFERTRVHSGHRPLRSEPAEMFARYPQMARLVERQCAFEIERFGYRLD